MGISKFRRLGLVLLPGLVTVLLVLAACAGTTETIYVTKEVIKEVPVEKIVIVKEIVEVPVEKIVIKEVEVIKVVEKPVVVKELVTQQVIVEKIVTVEVAAAVDARPLNPELTTPYVRSSTVPATYNESPRNAALVAAGKLPKVADRIGNDPNVITSPDVLENGAECSQECVNV